MRVMCGTWLDGRACKASKLVALVAAMIACQIVSATPAIATDENDFVVRGRTGAIIVEQKEFGDKKVFVELIVLEQFFSPLPITITVRCNSTAWSVCENAWYMLGSCNKSTIIASSVAPNGENVTLTSKFCNDPHTARCIRAVGKVRPGLESEDFTQQPGCLF